MTGLIGFPSSNVYSCEAGRWEDLYCGALGFSNPKNWDYRGALVLEVSLFSMTELLKR